MSKDFFEISSVIVSIKALASVIVSSEDISDWDSLSRSIKFCLLVLSQVRIFEA